MDKPSHAGIQPFENRAVALSASVVHHDGETARVQYLRREPPQPLVRTIGGDDHVV
jgi:hypothetical protein